MELLDVFLGTLEVTLPVFTMVIIGILLVRIGWIDTHFITTASGLVVKATMPTQPFFSINGVKKTVFVQGPGFLCAYPA